MDSDAQIKYLIGSLPEVYQPIYGFNEFNDNTTRNCYDRWQVVQAVADRLRAHLGRPLQVLDIGCAQGFFCFNLAAAGDEVYGIDWKPENTALCQELAKALSLNATFITNDLVAGIASLSVKSFDLLLGFSVFHHVCHRLGFEFTRNYIGELAQKATVCLFETAVRQEPMDWVVSLPKDPRALLDKFAFLAQLSEHSTRLSKIKRPIFFCSNQYWYVDEELQQFTSFADSSQPVAAGIHRHYFSEDKFLKYYQFTGAQRKSSQKKLKNEITFLSRHGDIVDLFPRLLGAKMAVHGGWILREKISGILLSTAITNKCDFNTDAVVANILEQLVKLEAAGFYHNDVRTCNILLADSGKAILLDYGAIGRLRDTILPPQNIYLAFLVFLYEIINRKILTVRKLSPMLVRTSSFPFRYQNLVQGMLTTHPCHWSFDLLAKLFHHQQMVDPDSLQLADNLEPWLGAMEFRIAKREVKLKQFERVFIKRLEGRKLNEIAWFKRIFKRYDALVE